MTSIMEFMLDDVPHLIISGGISALPADTHQIRFVAFVDVQANLTRPIRLIASITDTPIRAHQILTRAIFTDVPVLSALVDI